MAVLGLAIGAGASLVAGGLALAYGRRSGFVDRADDDLKPHSGSPVPLGGLAIMVGLHSGLAVAGAFNWGLLAATLVVWIVGLVDDRRPVSPRLRLMASLVAGALLVVLGGFSGGWPATVGAVLLVVVVVNAVNLLDGLDGLAGSVASVSAFGLATLAAAQMVPMPWAATILSVALVGFLFWNLPPAKLFLGDNGAYVVGVALAWAALRASPDWGAGLVATVAIGIPLLDLGVTVLRRLFSGDPLFAGDRDHTYDRLHRAGWSVGATVAAFVAGQALWSAAVVVSAARYGDVVATAIAALLGAGVVVGLSLTARSSQVGRE